MTKELTISDIGEKRLIQEFIRPYFNQENVVESVGDDCAMIPGGDGETWLFSTDRVPADLISFRLGIIDYYGLGRYLACLNISDIAACGGKPVGLLLNLGLPNQLAYQSFKELCMGFGELASQFGCPVLGGDISASSEISISATSIGKACRPISRRQAEAGDTIFVSKPIGLTPAAFGYHLRLKGQAKGQAGCSASEIELLNGQFSRVEPLVALGTSLGESGLCSACMDNTDGLGQSLFELAGASQKAFIVKAESVQLPDVVIKISQALNEDPLLLAFSAGADFSLVGTLHGAWSQDEISRRFGANVVPVGYVENGAGLYLESGDVRTPLPFSGWNYFSQGA